jgi:hypothetical protein
MQAHFPPIIAVPGMAAIMGWWRVILIPSPFAFQALPDWIKNTMRKKPMVPSQCLLWYRATSIDNHVTNGRNLLLVKIMGCVAPKRILLYTEDNYSWESQLKDM